MLGFPGQDKRIGTISVTDPADNYPTHWAYLSKGGHMSVHTLNSYSDASYDPTLPYTTVITSLHSIPVERREWGMTVFVFADADPVNNHLWILANTSTGGTDDDISNNSNWIEFSSGGLLQEHTIGVGNDEDKLSGSTALQFINSSVIVNSEDTSDNPQLQIGDATSYSSFFTNFINGSGDYAGTTIPKINSTHIQSGNSDKPLIKSASSIIGISGTTSTNFGYRLDANGFRIDTINALQSTNSDKLNVDDNFRIKSDGTVVVSSFSGSGERLVTADASGNVAATLPYREPFISDVAVINELENESNWSGYVFTGTVSNTTKGQIFINNTYQYFCKGTNDWIRTHIVSVDVNNVNLANKMFNYYNFT